MSKKSILLWVLAFILNAPLFSEDNLLKKYIEVRDLKISNEEILYNLDESYIPIAHLFCDEKGLYILINEDYFVQGIWNCPRCQALNPTTWFKCGRCGWPE